MRTSHPRRALATLSVFALALAACHKADDQKKGPPAIPVRVAQVTRLDAPISVSASGVVEPMQTVNVEAQASGTILDVSFRQGDWVEAGQVLFQLDPLPLRDLEAQSRAALARDEAQAAAARHDAERYAGLAAQGYVTRSQAEQMQAAAAGAAATVVADRAALRIAQRNLGYATIRAPISGRTGSVLLRRGDLVGPQTGPLVTINQLRPILVRFPVMAGDFDLLRAAVATRVLPVTANTGDSLNITERGTLSFLDNAIDSLTGTVTGRAVFSNGGSRLWPGQLVFLNVEAGVQRGVLAVPTQAIQTGQQGAYVYVVDPKTSAVKSRVVSAGRTVGAITVIASGLQPGEQVVTDGQSRLSQGSKVAVIAPARGDAGGTRVAGGAGGATGSVGGEVVTSSGAAGQMGSGGTTGGAGGANGGAGGSGAGIANGAMATDGGSGQAASGGRASPYSGAPSMGGAGSAVGAGVGGSGVGVMSPGPSGTRATTGAGVAPVMASPGVGGAGAPAGGVRAGTATSGGAAPAAGTAAGGRP